MVIAMAKDENGSELSLGDRMRRAAILCCHLTRNLAYFRVGHAVFPAAPEGDFLLTMIGNFIDIAVLDWCTLFGNHADLQHWKQLVPETGHGAFREALRKETGITKAAWETAWAEVKSYRDEFVAHLGSEHIMDVPNMEIPKKMVEFYYDYLRKEAPEVFFRGLPTSLADYHNVHREIAKTNYAKHLKEK